MAATITAEGYPDDLAQTTEWMREGTALFLGALAGLRDDDLDAPSRLPGWQRRHVCAHLARNAEGLGRLLSWAATGVATPMYPSPEAREAGIAESAQAPATALRADVVATAQALLDQAGELTPSAWAATVATARGSIPASIVPWFRTREVWIHAIDLDAGVGFTDLPSLLCAALVTELATGLSSRGGADLLLVSGDREWTIGSGSTRIEAPTSELAEWLTGRIVRPEVELPRWL